MCTINNRRTGEYYSSVWKVLIWVASPRSLKLHDGVLRDGAAAAAEAREHVHAAAADRHHQAAEGPGGVVPRKHPRRGTSMQVQVLHWWRWWSYNSSKLLQTS